MQRPLRLPQLLAKLREGVQVVVVPVDITQQAHQLFECSLIDAAMFLQAVLRASLQLIQIPPGLRHADDGQIEAFVAHQALQRGKNLLVRQIARGAKKNQCVGPNRCHSLRSRIEMQRLDEQAGGETNPRHTQNAVPQITIRTDVRARRADCHFSSRGRYFFQARGCETAVHRPRFKGPDRAGVVQWQNVSFPS